MSGWLVRLGVLPAHSRLREAIEAAAEVTETMFEGLSMATASLRATLEADLRANSVLRLQTVHALKIGGDASHDASEKEEKSSSILLLLVAWMSPEAGLPANSIRSHRKFGEFCELMRKKLFFSRLQ
jgi:hypothetical protein